MELVNRKCQSPSGHTLELVSPSSVLTNLDFVGCRFTAAGGDAHKIQVMHVALVGVMNLSKMVFGPGPGPNPSIGYHPKHVEWKFMQKRTGQELPGHKGECVSCFRISATVPHGTCPVLDATHIALPPTLIPDPARKKSDFSDPKVSVEYKIVADIVHEDSSVEELSVPFTFIPAANMIVDEEQDESEKQHKFSDDFKDTFGHIFGTLYTTLTIPCFLPLETHAKGVTLECRMVMTWHGVPASRPKLSSMTPMLQIYQSLELCHGHEQANKASVVQIGRVKGTIDSSTEFVQSDWVNLSDNLYRKEVTCHFRLHSDNALQPSFVTCLLSRFYKATITINFEKESLISRRRTVTYTFPIDLQSTISPGPDPDEEFMQEWVSQETELVEDPSMTLVDYFKDPTRKPDYQESMLLVVQPAPIVSRLPNYMEPISAEEANRVPAWQAKENEGSV